MNVIQILNAYSGLVTILGSVIGAILFSYLGMKTSIQKLEETDRNQQSQIDGLDKTVKESSTQYIGILVSIKGIETSLEFIKEKIKNIQ